MEGVIFKEEALEVTTVKEMHIHLAIDSDGYMVFWIYAVDACIKWCCPAFYLCFVARATLLSPSTKL